MARYKKPKGLSQAEYNKIPKGKKSLFRKYRGRYYSKRYSGLTKSKKTSSAMATKAYVDRKLDDLIEDKYVLDASYDPLISHWDTATRTIIKEITPTIPAGTSVSERVGQKITLKRLSIQLRTRPVSFNLDPPINTSLMVFSNNLVSDTGRIRIFVVSIIENIASSLTESQLRVALGVKFPTPGTWKQDQALSDGHKAVKAIKMLTKKTLNKKFRTFAVAAESQTAHTPFLLNKVQVINVAQYSHCYLNVSFNKKIVLNVGNKPLTHRYYIFAQFYDNWRNTSWDPPAPPHDFAIRNLWVYEDA